MAISPQTQPCDSWLVHTDILQKNNIQKGHAQFVGALLMMVLVLDMVCDLKAQAEARTNCEVSSFTGILLSWDGVSHWTRTWPFMRGWLARELSGSTHVCHSMMTLQAPQPCQAFYIDPGGSKWHPHSWRASVLTHWTTCPASKDCKNCNRGPDEQFIECSSQGIRCSHEKEQGLYKGWSCVQYTKHK